MRSNSAFLTSAAVVDAVAVDAAAADDDVGVVVVVVVVVVDVSSPLPLLVLTANHRKVSKTSTYFNSNSLDNPLARAVFPLPEAPVMRIRQGAR